jgi:hypothetical protein
MFEVCVLLVALQAAAFSIAVIDCVPPDPDQRPTPPPCWTVRRVATGGELGSDVETILIEVDGGVGTATRTVEGEGHSKRSVTVTIPTPALSRLWQTLSDSGGMDLPDLDMPAKDTPEYRLRMTWGGRCREVRIVGFSQSEIHRNAVLSIEQCSQQGVKR